MSFQAYLDNIEDKTGLTGRQLIALAHDKGLDAPGTKAGAIVDWLATDYDLGRGHAMAIVYIIQKGTKGPGKHVDSGGNPNEPAPRRGLRSAAKRRVSNPAG